MTHMWVTRPQWVNWEYSSSEDIKAWTQNGHHLQTDIFKYIFIDENFSNFDSDFILVTVYNCLLVAQHFKVISIDAWASRLWTGQNGHYIKDIISIHYYSRLMRKLHYFLSLYTSLHLPSSL